MMMLQGVTYQHPNGDALFAALNLVVNTPHKVALIGNNGVGKSTLLKILAGMLIPSSGTVTRDTLPFLVPQLFGQYNAYTIAEALQVADKLQAFNAILRGELSDENLSVLNEDWTIEERCKVALQEWGLAGLNLHQKMGTLSGGQKTRVFLAGIAIHEPSIVLMDEPSNHLDAWARDKLYQYLQSTKHTVVVVSHDRTLLNLLNEVYELTANGIKAYGGNYDFYITQQMQAQAVLNQDVKSATKALRKAKEVERESMARQQKLDARGKKKQEKAGLSTIMMNTLRNKAERSTSKVKDVHGERLGQLSKTLTELRSALPDRDQMKMDLDHSGLYIGKVLIDARGINFAYQQQLLWEQDLTFQLCSGERWLLKGKNGIGKTTLIQLILGQLQPKLGTLSSTNFKAVYLDQDYAMIDQALTVYEQAQQFNTISLQEHEIKIRLNRFLFTKESWDKPCAALSGGEKMRLIICALTISNQSPDLMVLDEPTNNLDMQNLEILTDALRTYRGALVVVSHDSYFLEQLNITKSMDLF